MTWVLLVSSLGFFSYYHSAYLFPFSTPPCLSHPLSTLPVKSEIKQVISNATPEFGTLQIYVSQEIIVLQMESFQKEMER